MTGISTLGQALDQISRIQSQQTTLDTLSTQIATGQKTQQFSGLGDDVLRSQRARADLNSIEQYTTNIQNAQRRIELITNSIEQISAQANSLSAAITVSVQGGDLPNFETTQRLADDVYNFLVDLINTQDGERYLFAGADSSIKPIENDGQFDTFLGTFVPDPTDITNPPITASGFLGEFGNGTITVDEFIDSYSNVNENVLGFSESLVSGSAGRVSVRVDENSDFDYTFLGNNDAIKDILIGVGVLKNLPNPANTPGALNDPTALNADSDTPPFPSAEQQENFFEIINDIGRKLIQAVDSLEGEQFRLNLVEAQTSIIQEQYTFQTSSLQSLVGQVENVDLTETIAKLQQAQLGLEASFSVTALLSDLSLVNFLGR